MPKKLLSLSVLVLLLGCQSPNQTASAVTSSDFCLVTDGPIRWSAKDTDETIIQVKKFNAIGLKLCHWKTN